MAELCDDASAYVPYADRSRLSDVVDDLLLASLKPHNLVFVGGIATRFHLGRRGMLGQVRAFNDVDVVATSGPNVFDNLSVQRRFLIHHFHPHDGRMVLVHRVSNTKVDVFPMLVPGRHNDFSQQVSMGLRAIMLQSYEWRLASTVWDLWVMPQYNKVDPKQLADALALYAAAEPAIIELASEVWQTIKPPQAPSLEAALTYARSLEAQQNYCADPWKTRAPYNCPQCTGDPGWPLARMAEVLDRLGYVEGVAHL